METNWFIYVALINCLVYYPDEEENVAKKGLQARVTRHISQP